MITSERFKELFNKLEAKRNSEIEIIFKNIKDSYMIIKYEDKITFGKENLKDSPIYSFTSLDDLYEANIINGTSLKNNWENINDILIDNTFSVITDKKYFKDVYNIVL